MHAIDGFGPRIERLDRSLLDLVPSQSTDKDRASWLALQRAVRTVKPAYAYLEIGSYLGGSLQQYLQDPRCTAIYSIDARTVDSRHPENTTRGMLDNLAATGRPLGKVHCFTCDARDVPPSAIRQPPGICFIDGCHTDAAVESDFAFCLGVCADDAVISFHDAVATRRGIAACLDRLEAAGRPYVAYKLPGDTFAVGLLASPLVADPRVQALAVAARGRLWLRTAGVVNGLRRRTPLALRPALGRLRRPFWSAGGG